MNQTNIQVRHVPATGIRRPIVRRAAPKRNRPGRVLVGIYLSFLACGLAGLALSLWMAK